MSRKIISKEIEPDFHDVMEEKGKNTSKPTFVKIVETFN